MESNTQTQNKLHWVYLVGFFLILMLPLLNLPPWFSPPGFGKTIVFRIILSILIFLFIWQILSKKHTNTFSAIAQNVLDRKNKVFWPFWLLIVLLGVYFLATIFSLDPYFSLWGNPQRSGGFINFAFYIIFAILAFLIIKPRDWKKIWTFSIIIGILVSIIAIFQQFGIFTKILYTVERRPPSTIGGPIFLAIYLLLLSFLSLSFGIKSRNLIKKLFYFSSFLLFIFVVVFITQTRAVFIGLAIGSLWFLFAYPIRKSPISDGSPSKKLILLKIIVGIILIGGVAGFYFLKTNPEIYKSQPPFMTRAIDRILGISISEGLKTAESRTSAWKVSLEGLKEKPILGYGPENFSIAFDKYYDPTLPGIKRGPSGSWYQWWDRAHNFIFDISVTAGIPALIIYLSLFGTLFWQLQKLKNQHKSAGISINQCPIICHGIQATFIGYFVANFFSFDVFSTYLISFLLIGYSLHLISLDAAEQFSVVQRIVPRRFSDKIIKWRKLTITILLIILIWFIWSYNIKPFKINTQINIAGYFYGTKKCDKALTIMENLLSSHTFLDSYLRGEYADIIRGCSREVPEEKKLELAQKAYQILKENTEIRPYYTRNWILLGQYTNILIDNGKIKSKGEANYYFGKAYQLSPKREELLLEWTKANLIIDKYEETKEKAQECIKLNPKHRDCYWLLGLSEIALGDFKGGKENIEIAVEQGYKANSEKSLLQLVKVYAAAKNYQELVETYSKLIALKPKNPQYYASIAAAYKELGEFEKAKKQALKVLELNPEARPEVEEFLKTLK